MSIKSLIWIGLTIIIATNLTSFNEEINTPILMIIGAIVLCLLMLRLDISQRSPDAYYELGFTYTVLSIIAIIIVLAVKGFSDDGFTQVVGNFGIALSTSAVGLILKVSAYQRPLEQQIQEYNNSIQDLTSTLRLATDDINNSVSKSIEMLNEQSLKMSELVTKIDNKLNNNIDDLDEALVENKKHLREIENNLKSNVKIISDNFTQLEVSLDRILTHSTASTNELNQLNKNIDEVKLTQEKDKISIIDKISTIDINEENLLSQIKVISRKVDNSKEEIEKIVRTSDGRYSDLAKEISQLSDFIKQLSERYERKNANGKSPILDSEIEKDLAIIKDDLKKLNGKKFLGLFK